MRTVVFLGPSLPREEARAILPGATFLPPASKGDVYRILPTADCIVLIDGVFHGTPSIWQRELLAAVEEGVVVIGAASMGALRAAELHTLGMRGCGTIFEWYKGGVIDGDDEVALLHAAEDLGWRALSEPLVNIRYGLAEAVREERITEDERANALARVLERFYPERSWRVVVEAIPRCDDARRAALLAFFSTCDRKREDARMALAMAREATASPLPSRRVPPYPRSPFLFERLMSTVFRTPQGEVTGVDVLAAALTDDAYREELRRVLVRRAILASIVAPRSEADAWGATPTVEAGAPVDEAWLVANGLTRRSHEELVEEHAALSAIEHSAGPVLAAWAEEHGVVPPPEHGARLESWLLEQDPARFGLSWHFETALMLELQRTGEAARFAVLAAASRT